MAVKIISATNNALDGILIKVEVDISKGLPMFSIVGLPDVSVREAKERVRSAIINSGYEFPLGRITVNLAPADLRKAGSLFDLPIALGILMESNQIKKVDLEEYVIFGELSLFGELKKVKGAVPIILKAFKENIKKVIFPYENIDDACHFEQSEYYPFKNLNQVISYIMYNDLIPYEFKEENETEENNFDYSFISGQYSAKRALTIAAAGMHNIILYGEPGCGKTMLAKALKSIMPPLEKEEILDIAQIYSTIGVSKKIKNINRPFRMPHHTVTRAAFIGGGNDIKPGEVTLAHNGILFLDEILQFKKEILECLREPLQEKVININRLNKSYSLPADFLLVGAFNPCEEKTDEKIWGNEDRYSGMKLKKYNNKLSSALLDRIDIMNFVPRLLYDEIRKKDEPYNSENMKEKVIKAREIQKKRYKNMTYRYNSEVNGKDAMDILQISKKCSEIMKYYYNNSSISMRGYIKILALARTIADIDERSDILEEHIFEAVNYRKNLNGELI